ncbi:sodium channel modifier 1 [Phtheirospermum japonicum]|uniref:Sodium channel modifier 1 n=1 Tax=Phtheirospermum japonicum TaxID=374723 RepID=A0A830BIJ4_9LAMI|nr:sodium channel modifier 1 [Phtheirospermum japonicum]
MSVFGGDSWAREAQCRKRRVDDLLIEGVEASAFKKLSNGKLTCLVCPNNPVLDTPVMLSTHVNGSRHRAAELRLKDKELALQEEVKKRLALSDCVSTNASTKQSKTTAKKKPLIERAKKAASEVFRGEVIQHNVKVVLIGNTNSTEVEALDDKGFGGEVKPLDYRARLERELKFTASGWKRDGHGRWFKDENVEFDSDEEDPNIVLNETT